MIAHLALLLAQAAPVSVPPAVQHMADVNVLIGSCERYLPRRVVAEIDAVTRGAPENVQRAVREWREEGRRARAERPDLYTRRVCLRLVAALGTY